MSAVDAFVDNLAVIIVCQQLGILFPIVTLLTASTPVRFFTGAAAACALNK